MGIRFQVEPRDVPPEKAARRLGLTLAEFERHLPELLSRNFPHPDVTTGHFDLDAIDAWRRRRNPHLFPDQMARAEGHSEARHADDVVMARLKAAMSKG